MTGAVRLVGAASPVDPADAVARIAAEPATAKR